MGTAPPVGADRPGIPVIVLLDKPPSTNSLFPTSEDGGRHVSTRYRSWRARQGNNFIAQRLRPMAGRVRLAVLVDEDSKVDLDNHLKAAIDCLVHYRLIVDDSWKIVRGISIDYGPIPDLHGVKMGAQITVTPV